MGRWEGLNRRRFPRVNYPCLVKIRSSENAEEAILAHTENVGIGGIGVILKQNIRMFCPVELELDLLDMNQHIQCRGRVVWNIRRRDDSARKPLFYDIGIEFDALDSRQHQRLEEIVRRLAKRQGASVKA